jgi:hypothetical protein
MQSAALVVFAVLVLLLQFGMAGAQALVATLTLNRTESMTECIPVTAAIDSSNGFAYFVIPTLTFKET